VEWTGLVWLCRKRTNIFYDELLISSSYEIMVMWLCRNGITQCYVKQSKYSIGQFPYTTSVYRESYTLRE
jgi:hypothetical protein